MRKAVTAVNAPPRMRKAPTDTMPIEGAGGGDVVMAGIARFPKRADLATRAERDEKVEQVTGVPTTTP